MDQESQVEIIPGAVTRVTRYIHDELPLQFSNFLVTKKPWQVKLFLILSFLIILGVTLISVEYTAEGYGYPTYSDIMNQLENLRLMFPGNMIVTLTTVGYSVEEEPIKMFSISNKNYVQHNSSCDNDNSLVMVVCGVHAREWTSPITCLYFIKQLQRIFNDKDNDDDDYTLNILRQLRYKFIVVANPDGYKYTFMNSFVRSRRIHRKNRRPRHGCVDGEDGVDLNRNFPIGFNTNESYPTTGHSLDNPCSTIYRGPAPFSEPETRAIRDAMSGDVPWVSFSVHGNGNAWMTPYAYKPGVADYDNIEVLRAVAEELNDNHDDGYPDYSVGASSEMYSSTPGTFQDWTYVSLRVRRSFTVEMRDLCSKHDAGLSDFQDSVCEFQPDYHLAEKIIPPETWTGFKHLLKLCHERDCT